MSAWSDFWFDLTDWVMDNIMMPMLVVMTVGIFVVLGLYEYSQYSEYRKQSSDPVKTAIVVERIYHPPVTTYMMVGKVMMPVTSIESWSLKVQGVSSNKHELRTIDIPVSHQQFEATAVGQDISIDQ